jgi:GNAT superfamily N-acetyltransferase
MNADAAFLFATDELVVRELRASEVPQLQALFDANPEYFLAINGARAAADAAQAEFDELPPPHLAYGRRYVAGVFTRADALVGLVGVLADFMAPGVWHIGIFLLATALHGSGAAPRLHAALERWALAGGARWLRLGVVAGNARAERFWDRRGYGLVRMRSGVDTGGRINEVKVMVKPLHGDGIDAYLALIPRDRHDSDLP